MSCPTPAALKDYASGRDSERTHAVGNHVSTCATCKGKVGGHKTDTHTQTRSRLATISYKGWIIGIGLTAFILYAAISSALDAK